MSTTLATILVLVLFGASIGILVLMKKRNLSFAIRVTTALIFGLLFGALMQIILGNGSPVISQANDWIYIVGNGYVRLLTMIVMPLVFISILSAIVTQKGKNLGKTAGRILMILMITVALSALISGVITAAFKLDTVGLEIGEAEKNRGQGLEEKLSSFEKTPIEQQILQIIPTNPFAALGGQGSNATLSVVFFAALIGIAVVQIRPFKPESAQRFEGWVVTLHDVVMRMVALIMRLTPYGVFALMIRMASTSNVQEITRLLKFLLVSYLSLTAMFVVHLVILALNGVSPIRYIRKASPALIYAFTSRTSAGTLPLTIKTQREALGVEDGIANLSSTMGVSIGQNGCAGVYPAMLAVMIAPSMGINPFDPLFLAKLVIITALASFGIAGVGGGATFAALTVLSALGFPVGLAGVLIAIEPLIDMGRTLLNVSDAMVAGVVTARSMGELNESVLNNPEAQVTME